MIIERFTVFSNNHAGGINSIIINVKQTVLTASKLKTTRTMKKKKGVVNRKESTSKNPTPATHGTRL